MNATRLTIALLSVLVLSSVSTVQAQHCRRGGACRIGGGFGGNVIDMRASTPIQGILMGEAAVIEAQGQWNKLTAEATCIYQDAYSKFLDNDVKRVEYYFKKKDIHDYYVERKRKPRLTSEAIDRINHERAPQRLASQHVTEGGAIAWPRTLEAADFAAARSELDGLFAERAKGAGGLGSDNFRRIQQVAGQMKSALQEQVTELDSTEYMQAKKFIDSLCYEARFEKQPIKGLASN